MRIVIAEDSALLREGLRRLLEDEGHEVVAAVNDGSELLDAVRDTRPDIAIIDVRMPPSFSDEGLRAALEIRRNHPDVATLVLSQYVEEGYAVDLVADGADGVGYLLKDRVADVAEFLDSLERVASGGTAIDPDVISQLVGRRKTTTAIDRLTSRELDVLGLMAQGRSNTAIAESLDISLGAVEKHVGNIFSKLALLPADEDHRRVLAVLAFLKS
jgi:DNA-binding NarL/FixJ family response regulator